MFVSLYMYRYQLALEKASILRRHFIEGTYNTYALAKELKVSTVTTWRYKLEFERIRAQFPDKLEDYGFYPGVPPRPHRDTCKYVQFAYILPALIAEALVPLNTKEIWVKYCRHASDAYAFTAFEGLYHKWLRENVTLNPPKLLDSIAPADRATLEKWHLSNDHRLWRIYKVLTLATEGASRTEICEKVETNGQTINKWLAGYRAKGLKAFELRPTVRNKKQASLVRTRMERLLKLVHESPKVYGLNRTSWSIRALTTVYNRLYPPQVTYAQVRHSVHKLGLRYKKSRQMLTSPDPKFREKIRKIQRILRGLKPDEKFFSIDEYGPVSIKIKGGRVLKQESESPDVVPEKQRAKGFVICTAALELSANQVSFFFSQRKNTFEMIRLIELLIQEYYDQSKLYLCWDAVSWHNSAILKNYIADHNKINKPVIEIAPLPACTQFLNVIESVFAGLSRAVIHNSDYGNVEECKQAISLYFAERNAHFRADPKRAGNKIWGRELVKAKFSETQKCRVPGAMLGAKSKPK